MHLPVNFLEIPAIIHQRVCDWTIVRIICDENWVIYVLRWWCNEQPCCCHHKQQLNGLCVIVDRSRYNIYSLPHTFSFIKDLNQRIAKHEFFLSLVIGFSPTRKQWPPNIQELCFVRCSFVYHTFNDLGLEKRDLKGNSFFLLEVSATIKLISNLALPFKLSSYIFIYVHVYEG